MMVKPLEFFLFRNYSVTVKEWLNKTVYLSKYPENNNVTIAYMTPDVAWAKYIYPIVNGTSTTPHINFYLRDITYLDGQNLLGFVSKYIKKDNRFIKTVPLIIYSLIYSVNLYSRNQSEMDVMLYQLMSKAYKNKKAVLKVDGQWAEISMGDPRNETNLEPREAQQVVTRYGIDLTIPRVYLPQTAEETGRIEQIQLDYLIGQLNQETLDG